MLNQDFCWSYYCPVEEVFRLTFFIIADSCQHTFVMILFAPSNYIANPSGPSPESELIINYYIHLISKNNTTIWTFFLANFLTNLQKYDGFQCKNLVLYIYILYGMLPYTYENCSRNPQFSRYY